MKKTSMLHVEDRLFTEYWLSRREIELNKMIYFFGVSYPKASALDIIETPTFG